MIAITTNNSTSVKPARFLERFISILLTIILISHLNAIGTNCLYSVL